MASKEQLSARREAAAINDCFIWMKGEVRNIVREELGDIDRRLKRVEHVTRTTKNDIRQVFKNQMGKVVPGSFPDFVREVIREELSEKPEDIIRHEGMK